ncbi:MAG: manganese efflux pump [Ruminococcaceae bacterium]|nr:manganese efflux pump [Oscillospiraceae bacterium]
MGLLELLILSIGLSMDACAVSICNGLSTKKVKLKHMAISGLWFGGFQALMPLIGYFLGATFEKYVTAVDHWIAFVLLGAIGVNMIREALSNEEEIGKADFSCKTMFPMAIATSIDALAIGITFALLPDVNIVAAVSFIGATTFILSALGVKLGHIFGAKYKSGAEFAGGAILIILGIKILVEHLFFS